jgi:hypothetical protein
VSACLHIAWGLHLWLNLHLATWTDVPAADDFTGAKYSAKSGSYWPKKKTIYNNIT